MPIMEVVMLPCLSKPIEQTQRALVRDISTPQAASLMEESLGVSVSGLVEVRANLSSTLRTTAITTSTKEHP